MIWRGSPDGYQLTNGLRWGIGAAFPQKFSLGFRFTAELFGEKYFDTTLTAPLGVFGDDGSIVPVLSTVKSPGDWQRSGSPGRRRTGSSPGSRARGT